VFSNLMEEDDGELFFMGWKRILEKEFGGSSIDYSPGGWRVMKPAVERGFGLQRGPSPSLPPVVSRRSPQMVRKTWSPGLT
jgi:hypothetical protein